VLTPLRPAHLDDPRVKAFRDLVLTVGAQPVTIDPADHDAAVAYLSHLPQLLSSALASLVEEKQTAEGLPLQLAASGFRDLTRLADSPYSVWRDICLTNSENIQSALDALIQKLEFIRMHLGDRELEREFLAANQLRHRLREMS
jgi:prephenate dehydrogenase